MDIQSATSPGFAGLVIRSPEASERSEAVRMLLSTMEHRADDAAVVDFMRYALLRDLGLQRLKVCADGRGRVWSASMSIVSPGRTGLIMTPGADPQESATATALAMLLKVEANELAQRDVKIAQVLVDTHAVNQQKVLAASGLVRLAELVFMQRHLRGVMPAPPLPAGARWVGYGAATHGLFAEAIEQTYGESLDCPALSSLRTIEDVIMGHKATGDHDDRLSPYDP